MAREFGFEPSTNPPYYFISYNSQDSARVAAVCREMNRRCVPMWYDRGLIAGEEWERQIAEKIRDCHEVIMFVTKNLLSRNDSYVVTEYDLAKRAYNKHIHIINLAK